MPEDTRLGRTLEEWTTEVDKIVKRVTDGVVGVEDGSDWKSWDSWSEEQSPAEGALAWAEAQDLLPDSLMAEFIKLASESFADQAEAHMQYRIEVRDGYFTGTFEEWLAE